MTLPSSSRTPATRVAGVLAVIALLLFTVGRTTAQVPDGATRITVRAVANDAKLIGSNVGGARIVITRVSDGMVLSDGLQTGSTGDTQRIIVNPRPRHGTVFATDGAAGFTTDLTLDAPTLVDITAFAPLGDPRGLVQASKRMWLVPGQHVTGEGILIELNGFTVAIQSPRAEQAAPGTLPVEARVTLLCGCPTEPGGLWDSADIVVRATAYDGDRMAGTTTLTHAGQPSLYRGTLPGLAPGRYRVEVVAMDASHANFGVSHVFVTVE